MNLKNIFKNKTQNIIWSIFAVLFILQVFIDAKLYILAVLCLCAFFVHNRDKRIACIVMVAILYIAKYILSIKSKGWNPLCFFGFQNGKAKHLTKRKVNVKKNVKKRDENKYETKKNIDSVFVKLNIYDCSQYNNFLTFCLYTKRTYYEKNILDNLRQNINKSFDKQMYCFLQFLMDELSKYEVRTMIRAKVLEDTDECYNAVELIAHLKNANYGVKYIAINDNSIVAKKEGKGFVKVVSQVDNNPEENFTEQDAEDMQTVFECIKHASKYDQYPSISIIFEQK